MGFLHGIGMYMTMDFMPMLFLHSLIDCGGTGVGVRLAGDSVGATLGMATLGMADTGEVVIGALAGE